MKFRSVRFELIKYALLAKCVKVYTNCIVAVVPIKCHFTVWIHHCWNTYWFAFCL